MAHSDGIRLKKKFGQHFLRDDHITSQMIEEVELGSHSSVFEIGCGDGFLTKAILTSTDIKRLWVFEIDPEWAEHVRRTIPDSRLTIYEQNFLEVGAESLHAYAPWTVLANLPYQVTFPILHWFLCNRALIKEGVIMVQEEVAHKITAHGGRGYGYISLYFQWFFEWKKLDKVPPTSFMPPPKVFSRLLYFKPRNHSVIIPDEQRFWKFIQDCFRQPRRTLRNNLGHLHYPLERISEDTLKLRAQQLSMNDLCILWDSLR